LGAADDVAAAAAGFGSDFTESDFPASEPEPLEFDESLEDELESLEDDDPDDDPLEPLPPAAARESLR
jgi:hypothetical protein